MCKLPWKVRGLMEMQEEQRREMAKKRTNSRNQVIWLQGYEEDGLKIRAPLCKNGHTTNHLQYIMN